MHRGSGVVFAMTSRNTKVQRKPVVLNNISQKRSVVNPSEDNIIVNKRSRMDAANNNDITFQYVEHVPSTEPNFREIDDVISLEGNEMTSVKGVLVLRPGSVQKVPMKDGMLIRMLDRYTVSDDTGITRLTFWGAAIDEVVSRQCYAITDVRVKVFNSLKYLTSTPAATLTAIEEEYEVPSAEELAVFLMQCRFSCRRFSSRIASRPGCRVYNVENKLAKLLQAVKVS